MISQFQSKSGFQKMGALVFISSLLSFASLVILWLEYGVLNFGDSGLPPYQPDTVFEKAFDACWYAVTIVAGLGWLGAIIFVIALMLRLFKRRES